MHALCVFCVYSGYAFMVSSQAIHSCYLFRPSIQANHSGDLVRLFIQAMPAKPTIFWKNAGNTAKRCGLMRWSFFLLNDLIILSFWYVKDRSTASYRSCRLFMQAIHAGSIQAIHTGYSFRLCQRSQALNKKTLETLPKDAAWCADHFSYWMTS